MPFLLPAAASAVAAAAPAAAAAGASAAASAGIGATLTSIAGNVLMNVAISAAMSIFQPQVGVAGRTFEWTLDPDGPIPFAAGRIGVPGSAVYRKTFGPDLMYYGTITEAGFVLNGLKCLCLNTDYDPATGVVRVSFVSETDAKYPFALGQDPTPPTPQVLTPVDPRYVTPPAPGDWTVTVPGPAPDGSQLPNIDLTGLVSNDTADALLISWRAVASGENPNTPPLYLDPDGNVLPGWLDAGSYAPTIRSLTIQGPKSGAVVWLALRYRRGSNFSAAELKGPITVRTLVADVMPNAPGLSQIKADIEAAFGDRRCKARL